MPTQEELTQAAIAAGTGSSEFDARSTPLRTPAEQFVLENPNADFVRGLRSSALNVQAGALFRDAELLEQKEGETRRVGVLRERAKQHEQEAAVIAPRIASSSQVQGIGDAIDFAQGGLGQVATTMLPTIAPSVAGGIIGGLVAGPIGATVGAGLAASYPAFQLEAGEAASNQQADPLIRNLPVDQRVREQNTKAALAATFEFIPGSIIGGRLAGSARRTFGKFATEAEELAAKKAAPSVAGALAREAGAEGATEYVQTIIGQQSLDRLNPNRDRTNDQLERIDSLILGMLGGGGISLATSVPGAVNKALVNRADKAADREIKRQFGPKTADSILSAAADKRRGVAETVIPSEADSALDAQAAGRNLGNAEVVEPTPPPPPPPPSGGAPVAPVSDASLNAQAATRKSLIGDTPAGEVLAAFGDELRIERQQRSADTADEAFTDIGHKTKSFEEASTTPALQEALEKNNLSGFEVLSKLPASNKAAKGQRAHFYLNEAEEFKQDQIAKGIIKDGETRPLGTYLDEAGISTQEMMLELSGQQRYLRQLIKDDVKRGGREENIARNEQRLAALPAVSELRKTAVALAKKGHNAEPAATLVRRALIKTLDQFGVLFADRSDDNAATDFAVQQFRRRFDVIEAKGKTAAERKENLIKEKANRIAKEGIALRKADGTVQTFSKRSMADFMLNKNRGGREAISVTGRGERDGAFKAAVASLLARKDFVRVLDPAPEALTLDGKAGAERAERRIAGRKTLRLNRAQKAQKRADEEEIRQRGKTAVVPDTFAARSEKIKKLSATKEQLQRDLGLAKAFRAQAKKTNELAVNLAVSAKANDNVIKYLGNILAANRAKAIATETERQIAQLKELQKEAQAEGTDIQEVNPTKVAKLGRNLLAAKEPPVDERVPNKELSAPLDREGAPLSRSKKDVEGRTIAVAKGEQIQFAEEQTGAGTQLQKGTAFRGQSIQEATARRLKGVSLPAPKKTILQTESKEDAATAQAFFKTPAGKASLTTANVLVLGKQSAPFARFFAQRNAQTGRLEVPVNQLNFTSRATLIVDEKDVADVTQNEEFKQLIESGATIVAPTARNLLKQALRDNGYRPVNIAGTEDSFLAAHTWVPGLGSGVARRSDVGVTRRSDVGASTPKSASSAVGRPTPEFDKLPAKSAVPTLTYAGVGSRETPANMQAAMQQMAAKLEAMGYTLNTGDAIGADNAFGSGAKKKNIFTAKDGTARTLLIAKEIHSNWAALVAADERNAKKFNRPNDRFIQRLMARNTNQVFGKDLDTPVDFVIVWTQDGAETHADRSIRTGGTGQAISLANLKGIPVINMNKPGWQNRLLAAMGREPVPATVTTKPIPATVTTTPRRKNPTPQQLEEAVRSYNDTLIRIGSLKDKIARTTDSPRSIISAKRLADAERLVQLKKDLKEDQEFLQALIDDFGRDVLEAGRKKIIAKRNPATAGFFEDRGRNIQTVREDILKQIRAMSTSAELEAFAKRQEARAKRTEDKTLSSMMRGEADFARRQIELVTAKSTESSSGSVETVARYTRTEIQANPDKIYVFGDNLAGRGLGGQAAAARGEPNAIGIPTKYLPNNTDAAFFGQNVKKEKASIESAVDKLVALQTQGKTIVLPGDGLGTGRAQLKERSPEVAAFLTEQLKRLEPTKSTESSSGSVETKSAINTAFIDGKEVKAIKEGKETTLEVFLDSFETAVRNPLPAAGQVLTLAAEVASEGSVDVVLTQNATLNNDRDMLRISFRLADTGVTRQSKLDFLDNSRPTTNQTLSAISKQLASQGKELVFENGEYVIKDKQGKLFPLDEETRKSLSGVTGIIEALSITGRAARKAAVYDRLTQLLGKDVADIFEDVLHKDINAAGQANFIKGILQVAVNHSGFLGATDHEAFHFFFDGMAQVTAARPVFEKMLKFAKAPHIKRQLKRLLANHPAALQQLSDPHEVLAYMFQFYTSGELKLLPENFRIFRSWSRKLAKVVGLITRMEAATQIFEALNDGNLHTPEAIMHKAIELQSTGLGQFLEKAYAPISKAFSVAFLSATDRLRQTNNSFLIQMADAYAPEIRSGKPQGLWARQVQRRAQFQNTLAEITRKQPNESKADYAVRMDIVRRNLQGAKPGGETEAAIRGLLRNIFHYLQQADVRQLTDIEVDGKITKGWVPIADEGPLYFARAWSTENLLTKWDKFVRIVAEEGGPNEAKLAAFRSALENGDGMADLGYSATFDPAMQAVNSRIFTFINEKNAHRFVEFQEQDLLQILSKYIHQATHRAEHTRTFGFDNSGFYRLLNKASATGATSAEIAVAQRAIHALDGTLGTENMTPLKRDVMFTAMTLVNFAVLPLALFSSLTTDPLGVMIRTGSMKAAGNTFIAGVRQIKNDILRKDPTAAERMAEYLGIVEEENALAVVGEAFQGVGMNSALKKGNDLFFNLTGLNSWTRGMRVGAMQASMLYLRDNAKNAQVLAELGLERGDIVMLTPTTMEVHAKTKAYPSGLTRDQAQRVQNALFRMVDAAILRPSPDKRSIWMSDARFMLMAHLKQFTFGFHNTITKQVLQNVNDAEGWAKLSAVAPLLAYVPFMIAADIIRSVVAGRADDDDDKDFADYLINGIQRSGITGVATFAFDIDDDTRFGGPPINTFLGPVVDSTFGLARSIVDPDVQISRAAVQLLPGYALWRGWLERLE